MLHHTNLLLFSVMVSHSDRFMHQTVDKQRHRGRFLALAQVSLPGENNELTS
jgi:hypothetical protein